MKKEEFKTTDKLYEIPYYNEKGYMNRNFLIKTFTTTFIIIFVVVNIFISEMLFVIDNNISFEDLKYSEFHIAYLQMYKGYILHNLQSGKAEFEFINTILASMILPLIFIRVWYLKIKFNANIQSNLASLKLNQYYLHKFNKKKREVIFKLIKGELMDYERFINKADDMKQLFDVGKLKTGRAEKDKIILQFSEVMPDIKNYPKMDFKQFTGKDKNFLGISDLSGTPVYSTPKEQGKGLLNGNWLIVGGSGSGKSFALKEMIQNFLLPENYKYIDKIFVINYKASADYNFLQGLDKFEYADDIPSGLKLLKKIQLDMMSKYKHNSDHSNDNFTAYQTIIIIDEVQTLNETLEAKSLHKIMKNTVQESLSILELLGSKIRASNGSLINVLQKADVNSLPSTAYRSNMRNRYMLKQENVSSAHLVVNSDTTSEMGINPLKLKQGQYLYWDMLTADLKEGYVVLSGNDGINFNMTPEEKAKAIEEKNNALNKIPMDEEAQKILNEVNSYREIAIEAVSVFNGILDRLEDEGKKTFFDTFEDVENDEMEDIFLLAEKSLAEKKGETYKPRGHIEEPESDLDIEAPIETIKEPLNEDIEPLFKEEVEIVEEKKPEVKKIDELDLFNSL